MAEDPRFLLHFKTLAKFKEKLADGTVNPDRHLVFIKDQKLVWCRGIYYSDASKLDNFNSYYNDWSISQANANTITITLKGKQWNETTREWEAISKPLVLNSASQTVSGLMSAADKTKSDRITTTDFTLNNPTATATSLTIPATKKNPATNATSNNNINIPLATTTTAGIINATEKKKLNNITITDDGITDINLSNGNITTSTDKISVDLGNTTKIEIGSDVKVLNKNNVLERVLTITDLSDGSVTKIGTADVGSAVKPIYLNKGVPTAGTYTFGNASGNAPISNGTLNTNLNADLLDGQHGSYYATATSVSNHIADKNNPHSVTKAQVGLGNVTNESKTTMFTNPVFTGTPTAPTAAATTNTTQIATTAFVQSAITKKLSDVDAMIYKGVVKSNSELPATHEAGWTYIVSVAGTYAGKVCEVGDMIICNTDSTTANNAHWDVIQTNINGAVTGPASATSGAVALFDGTTGKVVKNSATVGSATRPIYLNNGIPTAGTYTFGNANGNAAINNGTVNTNLNADMLDGKQGVGYQRDIYTYSNVEKTADTTADPNILTHGTGVAGFRYFDTKFYSNASATANRFQIAYPYTSTDQIHYRVYYNGAWTPWASLVRATDNIASASKLQTARNIALTGHVTGNANFDGGSNITITTTDPRKKANKVTNLGAIPADGDLCICTISANATLGLSGTLKVCEEVHVIIKNSGSSKITITIPSSFINTMSDPLEIEAGAYAELNILSDGTSNYVRGIGS